MIEWLVYAPCIHLYPFGTCAIYDERPEACREAYSDRKVGYHWYRKCVYGTDEDKYSSCLECGGTCCKYVICTSPDDKKAIEYWTTRGATCLTKNITEPCYQD